MQPDRSPIGPLDDKSFVFRIRLLSERARDLTTLRNAFAEQQSHASNFLDILSQLHDSHVEFVIGGGVAASLHGGSRLTFDLDIVPSLA